MFSAAYFFVFDAFFLGSCLNELRYIWRTLARGQRRGGCGAGWLGGNVVSRSIITSSALTVTHTHAFCSLFSLSPLSSRLLACLLGFSFRFCFLFSYL